MKHPYPCIRNAPDKRMTPLHSYRLVCHSEAVFPFRTHIQREVMVMPKLLAALMLVLVAVAPAA
jgi:hypothetical protein